MDDIMILFHKVVTDLVSFNDTQFGIFNESERPVLTTMFNEECKGSATKFIALLSPEQKQRVAIWACERSSFSIPELIDSLERFVKYLKKSNHTVYPKTATSAKPKLLGKFKKKI